MIVASLRSAANGSILAAQPNRKERSMPDHDARPDEYPAALESHSIDAPAMPRQPTRFPGIDIGVRL
jgi:hypothetical protein